MTSMFRVLKGTKFLFEGRLVQKEEAPAQLRRLDVRADEMDLLAGVEITITKRLSLAEVDRMISCCRQHPPQCVITPKDPTNADQLAAFKDLALYLTQRGRAGVGTLSSGLLALVTPIADTYDYMRCLIVNATATVGDIGAELPRAITIQPLSEPQTAPKERKKQKTSHRRDEQPRAMTDNQAQERPDTADVSHVVQEEPSPQVRTDVCRLLKVLKVRSIDFVVGSDTPSSAARCISSFSSDARR
ncbi:hypothetical protein Poli38472_005467 [Pythium oligandrum]|uniref:Uncharacterized protein n=1 Tax=Pythium oligandrum TaxID=41045 RepID=A0A8K1FJ81_PYTOL|nr:hypothetical protein Poli38472_005467 [Pythium oligandrum]|eukprot:TMW62849.1 hypothetical protein Poli38472_005467 [Pythium oligandrum]